ncbi:MAG: hypothetical protein QOH79_1023 [Acidimicrobiaceae bacterium]
MSSPGFGRAATRLGVVVAVVVALAGCGTPPGLDRQEQVAFARECASLIERGLSDREPPRVAVLGNEDVNLDDPAAFYSQLERLRGPSTYNLHDSTRSADTARQPLDACKTNPRISSSLLGPKASTASTATTTTSISTTVPGR